MNTIIFTIGNILKDKGTGTRHRIIAILDNSTILCEMNTTKFVLSQIESIILIDLISSNNLEIEDEKPFIYDINKLSQNSRERFELKRSIMNEVVSVYSPTFEGLTGKKSKPDLKRILNKYNFSTATFWRMCVSYFQSGMKDYSLIDTKNFGINKGKTYKYSSKPGAKSKYFVNSGIALNEEILSYFKEALNDYKSGRQKSIRSSYDRMNILHFTRIELINGVSTLVLIPQTERPTIGQFYYYVEKNLSQQEKDLIKTSAIEQRNNKRLITSDSLDGVYGPGDMVEIDACEADVSLVSMYDQNQTIGRPIVYFMIDVYTRLIIAMSVSFDNNSILGITNLFLNLADNKKGYCEKYGMEFDNADIWPSNIIPRRIRVDRGSEFKSREFGRICNELGIEKQILPGASGSLKGLVEQAFHQMHSRQNVHLENRGLIEKRYDSEHHKEATLNIEQYTKMVINFVLTHNQQYNENYHLTKTMLEQGIKPIPVLLWKYGVQKYGQPRPIPVIEQYLFNLMIPVKAKLSRRGICYKDLWYLANDDPILSKEMFNTGTKKIPFEVRMDMRDVSAVYYLRAGKLIKAPLNENLAGNADYMGLTMKQYEDYYNARKKMNAEGKIHNEELFAFNYAVNTTIIRDSKKETYSNQKKIRSAREFEKQAVSSEGKMSTRLETKSPDAIKQKKKIQDINIKTNDSTNTSSDTDNSEEYKTFSSFEEALALFDN